MWYVDAEAKPLNLSICIKEAEFLLSQAHKPQIVVLLAVLETVIPPFLAVLHRRESEC